VKLSELKIVVTGAAQGMGAHFALRLAEAGAHVAAGDVNTDGLASLEAEARPTAGKVVTRRLDVSSEADVVRLRRAWSNVHAGRPQRPGQQCRHPAGWPAGEEGSEHRRDREAGHRRSGTP
jgi:NAD(P)-dependent dehydrogenase (short-subunit alcohol dehydrogenase family)